MFQRLMDKILRLMSQFALAYVNDIIFSRSRDTHVTHMRVVLQRLRETGLTVNEQNISHLECTQLTYLSYIVSKGQLQAHPNEAQALTKASRLHSKKDLQCFLGLASYYRKFIAHFATWGWCLQLLCFISLGGGSGGEVDK